MKSSAKPWQKWIPGVLRDTQVHGLLGTYFIGSQKANVKASATDLTLSNRGWRLVKGSVKPSKRGEDYFAGLQASGLIEPISPQANGEYLLDAKQTYLFELNEKLYQPDTGFNIYGEATAKSSVGRMDVLARLIVDGMDYYEKFDPKKIKLGQQVNMYVEVTPITFDVKVRQGISLNQLRFFYGEPSISLVTGPEICTSIITNDSKNVDGSLSVDLTPSDGYASKIVVFRAKPPSNGKVYLPLWECKESEKPKAREFWDNLPPEDSDRLVVGKGNFYIMRSRERISVPLGIAVYCKAVDETIGEMRIHYAGFAHPYFGYERKDHKTGAPLVFEVRGHDVNVNLCNGEILAKLLFYRMSEDSTLKEMSYSNQELNLSTYFTKFEG